MKQRVFAVLFALLLLPGLAQAKIFLVDTDDTLRVVTASGVSTIHMYAAWADLTTTALTPGASDAQVTTATTTVLVAAPGSSTQRQIKGLSIRNSHASSSNAITVEFFDGATATQLITYTLLAGETLQWGEDENFRVIDASGQVKGSVTANAGTNLNTSALLTTSAHDAAFGTAGSADAQVRSVQGIASMTPLQVQSNGANLATAALQDGIIKDGTGDTTQANVSSGSLHVACQSGCSGGTQYAEDTAHVSGDTVTMAGVVRQDSDAALAADGDRSVLQVDDTGFLKVINKNPNVAADNSTNSTAKAPVLPGTVSTSAPTWTNGNQSALSLQTDGSVRAAVTNNVTIGTFPDNEPFNMAQVAGNTISTGVGASGTGTQRVASLLHDGTDTAQVTATAGGSLQVECTSGCGGSGGTSIADDAAFTPGTTSVTPAGAMFDDVTPDSVNEGDAGVLRMSANRNLYSTIRDAAGNERGANVNASNQLSVSVDNTASVNPGTAANWGVYAEDAAETAGGNLQMAGSVRRDTAASSAGATGDNATINTDANGLLWVRTMDPCSALAKTYIPINISTATTTEITAALAGASNHYYVCSINIGPVAGAQNLALVDDDTDNCASVTSGLAGGTTAGSGWNLAANSGLTMGNGLGSIARTNGTNRVLCLVSSAAVQTSGVITVVVAP